MVCYHLLIEMYAEGLTKEKLAEKLSISEQVLHDKIYGMIAFTDEERDRIELIFPYCEREYLFS